MDEKILILVGSVSFLAILGGYKKVFDFFKKNDSPKKIQTREKSLAEIKERARILVIDDRESSLVNDLAKEGWQTNYIEDLEKYSDASLVDAHVVCLDILGVGEKLRCGSGIGLVKGIKEQYPGKKILVYSSTRDHNVFDESWELVDKRIFKDGQPYQFIKGVQDLATEVFSWKKAKIAVYEKFKDEFGLRLSFNEFDEKINSCVNEDQTLSMQKIVDITASGAKLALVIIEFLKNAAKD